MEQDLQTILDAVEQLRSDVERHHSETNANFGAVQSQLNTAETRLQTQLNTVETRLQTQLNTMQSQLSTVETRLQAQLNTMQAQLSTMQMQLSTVEDGVLTIAQKLLADAEVAELKTKMRKVG